MRIGSLFLLFLPVVPSSLFVSRDLDHAGKSRRPLPLLPPSHNTSKPVLHNQSNESSSRTHSPTGSLFSKVSTLHVKSPISPPTL
ncbi:hypothetical protein B0J14DRAFT_15656 [Halenospora varia]|nr:hypothetical protein B0J14DRAFT_15656 [Halenospora varia]